MRVRDVNLMLARSATAAPSADPFTKPGWLLETKLDGYRLLAEKVDGRVELETRGRISANRQFPEIAGALAALPGSFILDGEVCCVDAHGIPVFEQLQAGRKRAPGNRLVYFVFDLLMLKGKDLRGSTLLDRKRALRRLIPSQHATLGYVDHIADGGFEVFERAVEMGLEGIVAKRAAGKYVGGRAWDWLKFKPKGYHVGWKRKPRAPSN